MKYYALGYFLLGCLFLNGCARTQEIRAVETGTAQPYLSLGTIEVYDEAKVISSSQTFWTASKILSLGLVETPSRGELYRKALNRQLVSRAKNNYDADAVIHVQYWPDPESGSFPQGRIYARGEMIRYRKFPSESDPPVPAAAS